MGEGQLVRAWTGRRSHHSRLCACVPRRRTSPPLILSAMKEEVENDSHSFTTLANAPSPSMPYAPVQGWVQIWVLLSGSSQPSRQRTDKKLQPRLRRQSRAVGVTGSLLRAVGSRKEGKSCRKSRRCVQGAGEVRTESDSEAQAVLGSLF